MQETIPQHNYRLDAAALESKRFGEVSCRDYREAIIRNLPHAWGRLSDTYMHEAHFAKHRTARGSEGRGGKPVSEAKKDRDAKRRMKAREAEPVGPGGSGSVTAVHLPPNALVAHSEEGMTAVNLYTGRMYFEPPDSFRMFFFVLLSSEECTHIHISLPKGCGY